MSTIDVTMTGDWAKAEQLLSSAPRRFNDALEVALQGEAEFLRGKVVARVGRGEGGKFGKQSPLTKATGGKGRPLVRSAEMRNSIGVVDAGKHTKFIGVPASAGERNVRLADIHENGRVIVQRLTRKMQAYLHKVLPPQTTPSDGTTKTTGILVTRIPARPFVGPVFEAQRGKIPARLVKRLADALDGDYGTA